MQPISYLQKQKFIEHLSCEENWRNAFSEEFFLADDRKGNTRVIGDVRQFVNDKGTKVYVEHSAGKTEPEDSGSAMTFEIYKDTVAVTDESGNRLIVTANGIQSNWADVKKADRALGKKETLEIPGTDLRVHFDKNGKKTLLFRDQQVEIPPPAKKVRIPAERRAQIYVASVKNAFALACGMPTGDLRAATQLVISCDLGIDPATKAKNTAETFMLYHDIEEQPADGKVHKLFRKHGWNMHIVQKRWDDTTQFSGYDMPTPGTFHIDHDDDGVNVITSLEQREAIWSQGDIFSSVLASSTAPVQTVSRNTAPRHMLNLLRHGVPVRDRRGREWSYVLVRTQDSLPVSLAMRAAIRKEFGLSARHCAMLTLDEGLCVMAMHTPVLDNAIAKSADSRANAAVLTKQTPAP